MLGQDASARSKEILGTVGSEECGGRGGAHSGLFSYTVILARCVGNVGAGEQTL